MTLVILHTREWSARLLHMEVGCLQGFKRLCWLNGRTRFSCMRLEFLLCVELLLSLDFNSLLLLLLLLLLVYKCSLVREEMLVGWLRNTNLQTQVPENRRIQIQIKICDNHCWSAWVSRGVFICIQIREVKSDQKCSLQAEVLTHKHKAVHL